MIERARRNSLRSLLRSSFLRGPSPTNRAFAASLFLTVLTVLTNGFGPDVARGEDGLSPPRIRRIDLLHFSHTDFGFTDHPAVCREMYPRYLDIALDAAQATRDRPPGERFAWTAEATIPVDDWWKAASDERREQFLSTVRAGQLEVTALPFNNTPFLNQAQWDAMFRWLPEELWTAVRPRVAIQNDVNGFPRAGALRLLDRGIRYLFTGINEDSGGVPFPRPSAFWWKMPDGRRLFVWLNEGYGSGFDFFEPGEWRRGPVPLAGDLRYRPPRAGDILRADEASLRAAHRICVDRLRGLERAGYSHEMLTISITNQWRFDNDPPFAPMADFVAAWNRLGLVPALRMVTVSEAMEDLERTLGASAPEYTGEWTDWWANGTASAPREVAASRRAKRLLAAVESPFWGGLGDSGRQRLEDLTRDLCLFDEHTWGSSWSVARPYDLDSVGQFNEKARLAYRPMAMAEWILSQRARTRLAMEGEGLFVANPTRASFSGWVRMSRTALREDYRSLHDPVTGARWPLRFEKGSVAWGRPQVPGDLSREDVSATFPDNAPDRRVAFWVEGLEASSLRCLYLSLEESLPASVPAAAVPTPLPTKDAAGVGPTVALDEGGWPATAIWPGMQEPLFLAGFGDFTALRVEGFAPRWVLSDIRHSGGGERRRALREKHLIEVPAKPEASAEREETPHTVVFTQALEHPRLRFATRCLELWKREPRARLTLRLDRLSSFAPEHFYVSFRLPTGAALPRVSSGGEPFTPFTDQLPGTCRDYFAIDGWAHYATEAGHWLWVSRDAPLITLGGSHALERVTDPPQEPGRILAVAYDNFWYTNFVGDSPGIHEFQFDLIWRSRLEGAGDPEVLAEGLVAEPVVIIQPALGEDAFLLERLFKP